MKGDLTDQELDYVSGGYIRHRDENEVISSSLVHSDAAAGDPTNFPTIPVHPDPDSPPTTTPPSSGGSGGDSGGGNSGGGGGGGGIGGGSAVTADSVSQLFKVDPTVQQPGKVGATETWDFTAINGFKFTSTEVYNFATNAWEINGTGSYTNGNATVGFSVDTSHFTFDGVGASAVLELAPGLTMDFFVTYHDSLGFTGHLKAKLP